MTEGSGLFLGWACSRPSRHRAKNFRRRLRGAKCTRKSAAPWIFRERMTTRASSDPRPRRQNGKTLPLPFSAKPRCAIRSFLPMRFTEFSPAIPANNMTCGKSSRALWTRANSRNIALSTAKTVLCGYARIGGWAVGIVANQKKARANADARLGSKAASNSGGVIYTEAAEKSRAFILDCNQNKIPHASFLIHVL